jgi:hypothetical protein
VVESVALAIILLPDVRKRGEKNEKMDWGEGLRYENVNMKIWSLHICGI